MRIRLKGINSITKRLADGTLRTYWYAWKGGPPLRGEPGTPEFVASYNEAVARKVTPPHGKLLSVLQAYQASEEFRGLADSTRRSYVALITRIERAFGDFPTNARVIMEFKTPARMRTQVIAGQSVTATGDRSGDVCAAEKYAHQRITAS